MTYNTSKIKEFSENLNAGDRIYLSGIAYTARDAAHSRMLSAIEAGDALPFELDGACIYYAGPTPTPEGMAIGSCGPTTSSRMDIFTPALMDMGLLCTIGKGARSKAVIDAIVRNKGVYFCALGGAGALASRCISKCEVIAYDDLGCESVKRITLNDFPLIVAIDCHGGNLFEHPATYS